MSPLDRPGQSEDVDQMALQLYRHLQAGRAQAVLDGVHAALAAAEERPALAARVRAWEAQAAASRGDGKRARAALRAAHALATAIGDEQGVAAVTELRSQLMHTLMARRPPAELADTPVARANQAVDAGDEALGLKLARAARDQARRSGDAREEVLALLVEARISGHAEPAIRSAAAVADQSNDRNLVTAVAHAAKAAGVDLGVHVF